MAYAYAILLKRVPWPFQIRCIVGQLRPLIIRYSSANRTSPPNRHPCPEIAPDRLPVPRNTLATTAAHRKNHSRLKHDNEPAEFKPAFLRSTHAVTYFSDYKPVKAPYTLVHYVNYCTRGVVSMLIQHSASPRASCISLSTTPLARNNSRSVRA